MNKNYIPYLVATAAIVTAGVTTISAQEVGETDQPVDEAVSQEDTSVNCRGKRHENKENFEAVKTAIENNDYEAWKSAISEAPFADKISEVINAENFDKFVEMHNLRQDGDIEGAQEIRDELGLPARPGKGGAGPRGEHGFHKGNVESEAQ